MRTLIIEQTVFKFEELDESTQQKALEKLWDINVDHDWWYFTYEDMERIGIKGNGFDLDRGSYCNIVLESTWEDVAKAILKDHGEVCESHTIAKKFLAKHEVKGAVLDILVGLAESHDKYDEYDWWETISDRIDNLEADIEEMEGEFKDDLESYYLKFFRDEYEYLTSEEAIKEAIEANEYEFDEYGNIA